MATKHYTVDVGNSTVGPVGYVARVNASSPAAALKRVQQALQSLPDYCCIEKQLWNGVLMRVYFNPDKITIKDVEEE